MENHKTLLDDLDLLGVADEMLFLLNDNLAEVRVVVVVDTIEVVKVVKGSMTTPVVERV